MNDDQYFLANAYLDGELTVDERRIAEADPAVMAEVEVLRDLQADLRDVDTPTPTARESAIGVAMAEFTSHQAVAATPTAAPAPVVPFRPKPAYGRYLSIAAAVVTVGLLGVVIVNSGGGDDDASTAEPAADGAADEATTETATRAATEGVAATLPLNASADVGIAAAQESADEAEVAADDMAATDMAEEMAEAESEEAAGDDAGAESPADADVVGDVDPRYDLTTNRTVDRPDIDVEAPITNDAELGAYGTYLLEQQNDDLLPPTPNTACDPSYNILDDAPAIINDVEIDVYIAVQEADERVLAIDRDACVPLVDGPLFPPTNG